MSRHIYGRSLVELVTDATEPLLEIVIDILTGAYITGRELVARLR